jgi:hypothetical protein
VQVNDAKVIGLICVLTWEMSKKPWTGARKKLEYGY